jgi:FkbM family methyltransferase
VIDRLLLKHMHAYRRHWPWTRMRGSTACLKWGFKDLQGLDDVLKLVPGRKVVVQAGGNLGLFPKRLAEEFAKVLTFEPDPSLFEVLKHNAPEKNIFGFCAALGDSNDAVALSSKRRDGTGKPEHEGLTHVCGPGDLPQVRLDEFDLDVCDLIYLDIEGYELHALRGAQQTIARCRPVLAVEINKNASFVGVSKEELRGWISLQGYRFVMRVNSDDVFVPEESCKK